MNMTFEGQAHWDMALTSSEHLAPALTSHPNLRYRGYNALDLQEVNTLDEFIQLIVASASRWTMTWLNVGRLGFVLSETSSIALWKLLTQRGIVVRTQADWTANISSAAWDWRTLLVDPAERLVSYQGHYWHLVVDKTVTHHREIAARPVQPQELAAFFLERDATWDSATCGCDWEAISLGDVSALKFGFGTTAKVTQTEAETFLMDQGLIRAGRFTRAAVLLMGKSPQSFQHLHDTWARIGFGEAVGHSSEVKRLGGNLLWQYAQLMKLLPHYLGQTLDDKGPYPRSLLHEAIVNALVHRDYAGFGDVQVRVQPDRSQVVVSSTGGLPDGLMLKSGAISAEQWEGKSRGLPAESLLFGQEYVLPVWRNPLIAHGLYLAGLMHAKGEGLQVLSQQMSRRQVAIKAVVKADRFGLLLDDTAAKATAGHLAQFSERQRVILKWVEQHRSISNAKVRELVNCSDETARIEIKALVNASVLRAEGQGKATRYFMITDLS